MVGFSITLLKSFEKAFRRLPSDTQKKARRALDTFARDPKYPSLNFEKVENTSDTYTIRVELKIRILLSVRMTEKGSITAVDVIDIGTHDQIYRRR